MRVPLSWLHDYCDPGLEVDALADLLTFAGLEVEAIHRPTGGVRGVVVAEVQSVAPVEGSDKLYLVEASDGRDQYEIVCGAANYTAGDRVPAALPGAILPGPDPDHPLEIGRKSILGHVSNGMLASPRELGISDDHAGIWVLDPDAPVGADLTEWLDLDDPVLEINVNPDRGYAHAVLGVARDVAAYTGAELRIPATVEAQGDPGVPVVISDVEACRRFDARVVRGVRVGPSPAWMQRRLAAAGMRPISGIVDATNYAMLETGHPVHAYDLARLAGPRIDVRRARSGERLVTLDGVERELDPDDLVIADADGPVGLAGVMGGDRTEVDEETTELLVEVAGFHPSVVLRTARRHKLFTEASTRFEKTVPPQTVTLGASRCVELITAVAHGEVVGGADHYPSPPAPVRITLEPERARSWLGMDLGAARQQELLAALGCLVSANGETLVVEPPAYRPDLQIPADLYEELARLEGYDKVPERVPASGTVGGRSAEHEAVRAARRAVAGAGWNEVLSFPFIADEDIEALGLPSDDRRRRTMRLVNPLSKDESVLRTTLLPGLLHTVRRNHNRQTPDIAVFEVGRVFLHPTEGEPGADGGPGGDLLPVEPLALGLAACGSFEPARHDREARRVDYYDLLGAVTVIQRVLGLADVEVTPTQEAPFHPGRAARLRLAGVDLGVVGELHPRVAAAYEVPPRTLAGELRLDILAAGGRSPAVPDVPSPLPSVRLDVAVVVDETVPAAAVEAAVRAGAGLRLTELRLFDVFRGPQVGEGRKSLAYALRLDDPARQLTDEDATATIEAIASSVADRVGGRLRR